MMVQLLDSDGDGAHRGGVGGAGGGWCGIEGDGGSGGGSCGVVGWELQGKIQPDRK